MATDPSPAPQPLSAVSAPLPVGARLGDIARRLSADRAVLLLAGITGVAGLSTFLVVPLLPLFASRLDAGPAQIGLLTAAFALASAAAQLVVGGRIDRLGPRTWLVGGAIVSSLAACLIALAGDAGSLVVWRGLAGLGQGATTVAARVHLNRVADPARRAFVNGLTFAAQSAGMVGGPALGGILSAAFDLRAPFLLVGAVSLLTLPAARWLPAAPRPAADAVTGSAVTPASAGDRRATALLMVAQLLTAIGTGVFNTVYPVFAATHAGLTPAEVGVYYSVYGVGGCLLGPWLAHLGDRWGRSRLAMLASPAQALLVVTLVMGASLPLTLVVLVVSGAASTAFLASLTALISAAAPPRLLARHLGLAGAATPVGSAVGGGVAAAVWTAAGAPATVLASGGLLLLPILPLLAFQAVARKPAGAPSR